MRASSVLRERTQVRTGLAQRLRRPPCGKPLAFRKRQLRPAALPLAFAKGFASLAVRLCLTARRSKGLCARLSLAPLLMAYARKG